MLLELYNELHNIMLFLLIAITLRCILGPKTAVLGPKNPQNAKNQYKILERGELSHANHILVDFNKLLGLFNITHINLHDTGTLLGIKTGIFGPKIAQKCKNWSILP